MAHCRTEYWWTCMAPTPDRPCCLDTMAESDRREDVRRDRDAHLATEHPDWRPTEQELSLSHWTER